MTRKLWVDDYRDAPDDTWTVVRTPHEAIRLLAKFEFEEVSLDHDIENRPDTETFQPVAYFLGLRWLYRTAVRDLWEVKVTIHSINPVGAREMQAILKDYGLVSAVEPYAPDMERLHREYGLS